jgi:hypothetical protein
MTSSRRHPMSAYQIWDGLTSKAPTFCFVCIDLGKIKGKGFKHFINRLKPFIKVYIFRVYESLPSTTVMGCLRSRSDLGYSNIRNINYIERGHLQEKSRECRHQPCIYYLRLLSGPPWPF